MEQVVVILAGFAARPKPGCSFSVCRGIDSSILNMRKLQRQSECGRCESRLQG
jgi:hypothetical protein